MFVIYFLISENFSILQARQSISKQRSRDPDEAPTDLTSSSNNLPQANIGVESPSKKIKLEETISPEGWWSSSSSESGPAVPDGTGCWPETAIDWPLEFFAESLCQDLFSQKWEVRHGAATALRELVRLHGKGMILSHIISILTFWQFLTYFNFYNIKFEMFSISVC